MEEQIDYVNNEDKVVGSLPRSKIKEEAMNYRIVHIFLFNSKDELLICKRPDNNKAYPNMWTSSAGGHVHSGESYKDAAMREMVEEIGIQTNLEKALSIIYHHPRGSLVFTDLWVGKSDNSFRFDPKEIISHRFISLKRLSKEVEVYPSQFAPPLLQLFERFCKIKSRASNSKRGNATS